MEGSYSNCVHVCRFGDASANGTGSLGPLLFLCHINDFPLSVDSEIRLFADDCLIYREINSIEDKVQLQKYLDSARLGRQLGHARQRKKCYIVIIILLQL